MKAKIAHRNIRKLNPDFDIEKFRSLKSKAAKRLYLRDYPRVVMHPLGDIVEHPDAFVLVLQGIATPEDDECREVCGLTDEEIQEKLHAYSKLSRGMGTGLKKYDVDPEATEAEDEFNALFKEDEDDIATD